VVAKSSESLPRGDYAYPPFELMSRVCDLGQWSEPQQAYEQMGAETKSALLRLLPADWSFTGRRVLDFGCGAGRTLRHFIAEAGEGEFWGSDIDGPSIEWMNDVLSPPLHGWKSAHGPPLGLEPGSFDLIWAISVFTHLPQTSSLQWLLELHRLLKPGGFLIATYSGRWNSAYFEGEEWDDDRIGMNVLQNALTWEQGGPSVLMSDWWVRAHWGRAFDIVSELRRFHNFTWVLMRRREVELTPEDLERPEDDPREHAALRHNIRQIQREVAYLTAQRDAVERAVRQEYENSLSWRLTKPLREARLALRRRGSSLE
jgi:SAM-dependent methyltransferase